MTEEHKKYLTRLRRRKLLTLSLQIGILALALGIWELIAHFEIVDLSLSVLRPEFSR